MGEQQSNNMKTAVVFLVIVAFVASAMGAPLPEANPQTLQIRGFAPNLFSFRLGPSRTSFSTQWNKGRVYNKQQNMKKVFSLPRAINKILNSRTRITIG